MNGAADMGGMHGFGPVQVEPNEPVFHADWERRIFALNNAAGASGAWTLDTFRQTRESIPPPEYLALSYYALWVVSLENLMIEYGLATVEEVAAGRSLGPANPVAAQASATAIAQMIAPKFAPRPRPEGEEGHGGEQPEGGAPRPAHAPRRREGHRESRKDEARAEAQQPQQSEKFNALDFSSIKLDVEKPEK